MTVIRPWTRRLLRNVSRYKRILPGIILALLIPPFVVTLIHAYGNEERENARWIKRTEAAVASVVEHFLQQQRQVAKIATLMTGIWQTRAHYSDSEWEQIVATLRSQWPNTAIERFDRDGRLLSRICGNSLPPDACKTAVNRRILRETGASDRCAGFYRTAQGVAIEVSAPVLDRHTASVRGWVVASCPLGPALLQEIKQDIRCDIGVRWGDAGAHVTTVAADSSRQRPRSSWQMLLARVEASGGERWTRIADHAGSRYALSYQPIKNTQGRVIALVSARTDSSAVTPTPTPDPGWLLSLALATIGLVCGSAAWVTASVIRPRPDGSRSLERVPRLRESRKTRKTSLQAADELAREGEVGLRERIERLRRHNRQLLEEMENRKQAEQKLRESEEKYRNWVERTAVGMVVAQDSVLIHANARLAELLGCSAEELAGTAIDRWIRPELRRGSKVIDASEPNGENTVHYDAWLYAPDGRRIPVEIDESRVTDQRESFKILVVRDNRGRKQREDERITSRILAATRVLAGGIAHDFNNLMAAVLGNIQLAEMRLDQPEQARERLVRSEQALEQAKRLTAQLLVFARDGSMEKRSLRIGSILGQVLAAEKRRGDVRVQVELDPDLWAVSGDEQQIYRALDLLLTNAEDALPGGGVVSIKGKNEALPDSNPSMKSGAYVRIEIQDRGPGIGEEDRKRIFEPYFSSKERGSQKGMGLGLAMVHSIVRRHHGYIEVTATGASGTTVVVYLPARR